MGGGDALWFTIKDLTVPEGIVREQVDRPDIAACENRSFDTPIVYYREFTYEEL